MSYTGQKLIGGLFGLEPPSICSSQDRTELFTSSSTSYFLSARCAIYAICSSIKPKVAWLPAYLCDAILEPLNSLKIPVRYFDDGPNFKNDVNDWVEEVGPGDLVLAIHYFGFSNKAFPAKDVEKKGAVILEDASQGLFLKQEYPESKFIVYSPRKFLGVPDGGVVVHAQSSALEVWDLGQAQREWWGRALTATLLRRQFDLMGGQNEWFSMFQDVEGTIPIGSYKSSDVSRMYVENGSDYEFIKGKRRENYQFLLGRLEEFALFRELDAETVPLGFPIRVDESLREKVLNGLYEQKIYPAIHWGLKGTVPIEHAKSHALSRSIITLVCDQRYTTSDMARQADSFLAVLHAAAER